MGNDRNRSPRLHTDTPSSSISMCRSGRRDRHPVLIFKILRNALDAPDRGKVCIVGRNPDAIWFDDYEDRVIYDEAGLFDYARVDKKMVEIEIEDVA